MVSWRILRGVFCQGFLVYVFTVTSVAQQEQDISIFDTSCGNISTLSNFLQYGRYCTDILSSWYTDNYEPYYSYWKTRSLYDPLRFQNTSQSWSELCRWSWNQANCFEGLLPHCNPGIGQELLNNPGLLFGNRLRYRSALQRQLIGFYRKTCAGKALKVDVQNRVDNPNIDANTSCINEDRQKEFGICLISLQAEERKASSYFTSRDVRDRINIVAEAGINCLYSAINRSPCNRATKRMLYHVAKLQLPHYIDEKLLNLDESNTADFSSLFRCTVGVYGDPHLRMCFERGFTTCSAVGHQTLIANGWFSISGTHEAIGRTSTPPATSLRSIQVVFLSFDTTRVVATYVAENGNLPSTFEGTRSTDVGTGNDRVTLTKQFRQIQLIQHSTGMVLMLRQWSGNYFFTLRVAQGVIRKSYGLLATGCPADQVINRSQFEWSSRVRRRKRAVTREMCETACNETISDDEGFRDTCAFDCFAVDDIMFGVNITLPAAEDIVLIATLDEQLRSRAVSPPKTTTTTTASPNPGGAIAIHPIYTLPLTLITGFICWALLSFSSY